MKFILHIGRPKSGTSALQHFLWGNRERLLQRYRILYPESVMHHRASHKLALVFQPYLPAYRVVKDVPPGDVYARMFEEFAATDARTLVASSENMFLVDPEKVRRELPNRCDTEIVCYVRRQDHVLSSSLVEEIKTGLESFDLDIEGYVFHKERLAWLDYAAVLGRWSDAFGARNITVRVYQEPDSAWSIFEDFSSVVGSQFGDLDVPGERLNPSPARDVLEFIDMINRSREIDDGRKPVLREPIIRASEWLNRAGGFDAHQIIPFAVRREVLARFERSNRAVARKYLGRKDGVLFDSSLVPSNEPEVDYPGMDLQRFAVMVAGTLCSMQSRIDTLEGKIETLRNKDG